LISLVAKENEVKSVVSFFWNNKNVQWAIAKTDLVKKNSNDCRLEAVGFFT